MAQFSVKLNKARADADAENNLIRELGDIAEEIRNLSSDLGFQSASAETMRKRLVKTADKVSIHQESMSSMHSALQDIIAIYERTENAILGNSVIEEVQDTKPAAAAAGIPASLLNTLFSVSLGNLSNWTKPMHKPNGDLQDLSFSFQAQTGGSLYENQIQLGDAGSLSVAAGTYEAYASAEGGVYTQNANGEYVFNPHVNAQMGASVSALTLDGNLNYGDELLGANATGSIHVGEVSAQGSLSAGLMNNNGSFDPHLNAGLSAEAIAVEAEASAGVTVLGTDATVSGSVYVGAGAHANIEIGNGVISCDVGAAIGIGASLSFTIDVSGTIDAVQNACTAFFNFLGF